MKFRGGFGNACKTFTASHHAETTHVELFQNSGKVLVTLKREREINDTPLASMHIIELKLLKCKSHPCGRVRLIMRSSM